MERHDSSFGMCAKNACLNLHDSSVHACMFFSTSNIQTTSKYTDPFLPSSAHTHPELPSSPECTAHLLLAAPRFHLGLPLTCTSPATLMPPHLLLPLVALIRFIGDFLKQPSQHRSCLARRETVIMQRGCGVLIAKVQQRVSFVRFRRLPVILVVH